MRLSDSEIQRRIANKQLNIEPLPPDRSFQPTSIDLHLNSIILQYPNDLTVLDIHNPPEMTSIAFDRINPFLLPSHGFVLGSTIEFIKMPNDLVAIIEGKSSLGRLGITAHITAGFIDPGFKGNITLEIFNVNKYPIALYPEMAICQICFEPIQGIVDRPYGSKELGSRYQNSSGVIAPKPEIKL